MTQKAEVNSSNVLTQVFGESNYVYQEITPQELKENRIKNLLRNSNIAPRYADSRIDNFEPKNVGQRQAKEFAEELTFDGGCGAVFIGSPATGKTHLLCGILKKAASKEHTVLRTSMNEFFLELKDTFTDSSKSEKQVLDRYAKVDVLVIEDIQPMKNSEDSWQYKSLFMLLDRRYEAIKNTFASSNCTGAELKQLLDHQTRRRFSGTIFNFDEK